MATTHFTPREEEIIRQLKRGATNKEIADALSISPKTVESHISNIYAVADLKRSGPARRIEFLRWLGWWKNDD